MSYSRAIFKQKLTKVTYRNFSMDFSRENARGQISNAILKGHFDLPKDNILILPCMSNCRPKICGHFLGKLLVEKGDLKFLAQKLASL